MKYENEPIVNVSLQVLPLVEEAKLYYVVDKVIDYIKESKVDYVVGPMETTMEGPISKLLDIVKEAQKICIKEGASRVVSVVKIDYRESGITIDEKIEKYK